jgi:hypothetical protein
MWVGEREREEQLATFLGNVNSSTEKLFAVCSSPMRKNPPFFYAPKIRQHGLRNHWDPALSSHTVKKKKAKENLRHKSHYCIAQSPKGEAEIKFLLPYLCAENHCYYYGLNPSSYLD